jgi:cadmium resistance protein CadD (predicted permease)
MDTLPAAAAAAAVAAVGLFAGTNIDDMVVGLRRWGHWIIPAVYVLIGLYIFRKAGFWR